MQCFGYKREAYKHMQKDRRQWFEPGTVDYIDFHVFVKNRVFSDDLDRQIAYYYAQNEKKPMILEYLAKEHPGEKLMVLGVMKYVETGAPPDCGYDDLSGDFTATVMRESDCFTFDVLYVSGGFMLSEFYYENEERG